jgi:hypothetical protein
LGKDELQRATFVGVATGYGARMMFGNAFFEIVGMASVVAVVGALENVYPEGHYATLR